VVLLGLSGLALAGPRIPGSEPSAPREAISEEESLDDFDPLEGMVVSGRLQAPCVFENVRPGISFVVYEADAWLRPSTGDDRKIVTRDADGGLWRVDQPREIPIGGTDDNGPYVQLKGQRTPLRWDSSDRVVVQLFEAESTGAVEVTLTGNDACTREDSVLAAGAYWYWIAHRASLGPGP